MSNGLKGSESTKLSPREMQIATMVWQGYTSRAIALELGISKNTEQRHMSNIFTKTGMGSRVELALWMERHYGDAAPVSTAFRVSGDSARLHIRAVQTAHGAEMQIEVVGQ